MSKTQQLPSYANGLINNEIHDLGIVELQQTLIKESLECSPYFKKKSKKTDVDFFFRKFKKD